MEIARMWSCVMELEWDASWDGYALPRRDWHFHRRLYKRYHIFLYPGEYAQLKRKIIDGNAQFMGTGGVENNSYRYRVALTRWQKDGTFVLTMLYLAADADTSDLITVFNRNSRESRPFRRHGKKVSYSRKRKRQLAFEGLG